MILYKPLHFFFGEYVLETEGRHFSRFATLLAEKGISFWGTALLEDKVRFKASVFVAEKITELAREACISVEIVERKGLPFIFSKYRKRWGLISGLFFGLFLMFYSQLFVWKLDIEGNVNMSDAEIERALSECGISVGSFIPDIDVAYKANELLINCEGLSSAAISIKGTHLTLSVLERTPIPEIVDTGGFFNVIATDDGIILDVDAADGAPQVKEGDAVFKGELLISCFLEGRNGSLHPTHARGNVYAAVKKHIVCEIPFSRITKNYTGEVEKKRVYQILGREFHLFSSPKTDFEYFDAISSERKLKLFGFIELPIKEIRIVYNEYIPEKELITASLGELFAKEELSSRLAELECEVLSCETEFSVDEKNGKCVLTADAVIKQNIAKEVPLEILSYNISERLPSAWE